MNRFQSMAVIMTILKEDGRLKPGTPEYKVARELIIKKIDLMGPDAAVEQAKRWRHRVLDRIDAMATLQDLEEMFPFFNF